MKWRMWGYCARGGPYYGRNGCRVVPSRPLRGCGGKAELRAVWRRLCVLVQVCCVSQADTREKEKKSGFKRLTVPAVTVLGRPCPFSIPPTPRQGFRVAADVVCLSSRRRVSGVGPASTVSRSQCVLPGPRSEGGADACLGVRGQGGERIESRTQCGP